MNPELDFLLDNQKRSLSKKDFKKFKAEREKWMKVTTPFVFKQRCYKCQKIFYFRKMIKYTKYTGAIRCVCQKCKMAWQPLYEFEMFG